MDLLELLESQRDSIVDEAVAALSRSGLRHYAASGAETNRDRLTRLFDLTVECVRQRSLVPMIAHAKEVAAARHRDGFDLQEVQTAFNVLEEIIWKRITTKLPPGGYPEAFGLTSTVLGRGKQALAVEYVSLASRERRMESLDVSALFEVM